MSTLAKKLMKTNTPVARTTNPNTLAARLRTACATRMLPLLLLLTLPAAVQAQYYSDYTYTVSGDQATITGYTGSDSDITIPHHIFGHKVTAIADWALQFSYSLNSVVIPNTVTNLGQGVFYYCDNLTSVSIPNSITSISDYTFGECYLLNNVSIPNGVTSIGDNAFVDCWTLTSISLPNSLTSIGADAFGDCYDLTSIIIPSNVNSIGDSAFAYCNSLLGIYFMGNAPSSIADDVFDNSYDVIVYYLGATSGWSSPFCERIAEQWTLPVLPVSLDFGFVGVGTNQFGFSFSASNLTATSNLVVVVEACTNLGVSGWFPMVTNTLTSTSSSSYFSEPAWTNYPSRMYRLRSQ